MRRKSWQRLILVGVVTVTTLQLYADGVGSIEDIRGQVTIDAFGTGAFISAIDGDVLYEQSVVSAGRTGSAVIVVGGERRPLPAGSTVRIRDVRTVSQRRGLFALARSVGRFVGSIIRSTRDEEEEVALGSRASESSDDDEGFSWVEEEDEDEQRYLAAREHAGAGEYDLALEKLLEIEYDETDIYTPEDLAFWRGLCYFQLAAFGEAETQLTAALEGCDTLTRDDPDLPLDRLLAYQLGTVRYLLGRPGAGTELLEEAAGRHDTDEITGNALLVLIPALAETGREDEARRYLSRARALRLGAEYAGLLDDLEKSAFYDGSWADYVHQQRCALFCCRRWG